MTSVDYAQFDKMSPFEIKDGLIKFAKVSAAKSASALLNAGRGNPNWIATAPREASFLFGQFALTEARRAMDDPQAGSPGMPQPRGAAGRLAAWLSKHSDAPGATSSVAPSISVSRRSGSTPTPLSTK